MADDEKVLVLDDDTNLRMTLCDVLKAKGYVPVSVAKGKTALDRVAKESPSVALIDLKLADMSGIEVMRGIKKVSPCTECIVITGHASRDAAIEAVNLGAYGFIEKPYEMNHLLLTVRRAVEKRAAEQALRESEERYRAVAEDTPVLICRLLPDGEITYVNNAYCRYFDKTLEELVGLSFLSLIPEEERETVMANISALTVESPTQSLEHQVNVPGGEVRWQRWTNRALFDAQGQTVAYQSIGEDITEAKRAESERETMIDLLGMLNAKNDLHGLMRMILAFMRELSGCEAVGIRLRDGDDFPYYETSGFSDEFVEAERSLCARDLSGQLLRDEIGDPVLECMCGNIICGRFDPSKPFFTDHGSFISNCTSELLASTTEEDRQSRTRNRCNAAGYESVFLVPLRAGGETFGLIQFNDRRRGWFSSQFIALAERLADNVAIALAQRRAEEALRQSEEQFRRGVMDAPVPIMIHAEDGEVLRINNVWTELTGYTHGDIPTIAEWTSKAYGQRMDDVRSMIDAVFERDAVAHNGEFTIRTRSGRSRTWDFSSGPLGCLPDGRRLVISMATDVTERKRAEANLERESHLRTALLDNIPRCIALILKKGTREIVASNKFAREIGAVPGQTCFATCAMRDDNCPFCLAPELWQTGQPRRLEVEYRGTWYEGIWEPLSEDLYVHYIFNITERKRAEEALRESEDRYRVLAERNPHGIQVIDPTGTITYVNPAYQDMLGYTKEELLGNHIVDLLEPASKRPELREYLSLLVKEQPEPTTYFQQNRRKDGQVIEQAVNWNYSRDGEGNVVGFISVITDITERKRAEEAVRESERLLLESQNVAQIGSYVVDIPSGAWQSSPVLEHIFGIGEDYERSVESWLAIVHPDDRQPLADYFAHDVIEKHGRFDREYRVVRHDDGIERWVQGLGKLEFDAGGSPTRMVGTIQDITERKRAEAALRRQREEQEVILDSVPAAIFYKDRENRLVRVNKALADAAGMAKAEMEGMSLFDLYPDIAEDYWRDDKEVMASGQPKRNIIEPLQTPQGTRWLNTDKVPYVDENGNIIGVIGFSLDITERKQAEEAQARLTTAIEQAAETVVITDAEGTIQYANPAFERTTGYSREEALGQNPRILKSDKHDDAFYKELWDTLTRGETWSGRFTNKRKDGTLFEEEASISPVRDTTGKIVNYVAVKRDVTKEVALEAQLRQAQKMEAVGQLAGGVAHDFNNILTAILGNAELLHGALATKLAPDDVLLDDVSQITRAAQRAARLTRQLLTFSHQQVVQPRVLDLNQVLLGLEKMLRRLITEDIRLTLQLPDRLGRIRADAGQIEQVITNLAVNARDAMPTGGTLTLETADVVLDEAYVAEYGLARGGPHVLLAVSDTGCGMDITTLEHVFEPFFTTKEIGHGTGMGLATVHGIVEQAGGHVRVHSEPGKGATFRVYLPAVDAPVEQDEAAASDDALHGTETVLVCEDNVPLRRITDRLLQDAGYAVLVAGSGPELLALVAEHHGPLDLLVTDVVMPGMNGRQLAERLAISHPRMGVMYMSGHTSGIIAEHGVLAEGVEFLEKPFNRRDLLRRVREVLDRPRGDTHVQ